MDLNYLLQVLLRRRWMIFLFTFVALAAGLIFTFFIPKKYVSLAQYSTGFTMEQKVKITDEATFNIYEIDMRFNNVIETFKSPKVMAMLSYNLLLHDIDNVKPFRTLTDDQRNSPEYQTVNIEKAKQILKAKVFEMNLLNPFDPEEKKVYELINLYRYGGEHLSKGLRFSRVERSDFIDIFFESENPELSAYVVNTIGEQFIRFFNNIYGTRDVESAQKLDSLIQAQKLVVDSLNSKLKEFRDRVGTPNVNDRASGALVMVQDIIVNIQAEQKTLNQYKADLRTVEQQLAILKDKTGSTGTSTNNNQTIRMLVQENGTLEAQKIGKSEQEIKNIDAKIAENLTRIESLKRNSVNTGARDRAIERTSIQIDELESRRIQLENSIRASNENIRQFETEKSKYERFANTGGGDEVILRAKESELSLATDEYEMLRKRMQSTLGLDVNPISNFKPTIIGIPAYKPQPTNKVLIMGICGFLGFFFSSFAILGVEILDNSYKTPSSFRRTTKLPQLGIVNKVDVHGGTVDQFIKESIANNEGRAGNIFIENLRKIRYEIDQRKAQTILFTSNRPQEGKTFMIQSVASVLALIGKKVLVIDANLSNNELTQIYEAKPSLDSIDLSKIATNDRLWTHINETTIPGVSIIGTKTAEATPHELLPNNHLLKNLNSLKDKYDYILIEASALNYYADSKEISGYVDGIINVVSAKSSSGLIDKESFQFLQSRNEKYLGAIFNQVETQNINL